MSTGCALDENWVNIVVKNSPLFCLGSVIYFICISDKNSLLSVI